MEQGDLAPVEVRPLPAQQAILDAFAGLGLRVRSADLERGHVLVTRQRLPFHREIEFFAPQRYAGLNQVDLSFVAGDRAMDVVMEMDKKPACSVRERTRKPGRPSASGSTTSGGRTGARM